LWDDTPIVEQGKLDEDGEDEAGGIGRPAK
jgi:hypothetical protein